MSVRHRAPPPAAPAAPSRLDAVLAHGAAVGGLWSRLEKFGDGMNKWAERTFGLDPDRLVKSEKDTYITELRDEDGNLLFRGTPEEAKAFQARQDKQNAEAKKQNDRLKELEGQK